MSIVNSNGYIQPLADISGNFSLNELAMSAGKTLTLAQVMNGYIHLTGAAGAQALTTPTAAALISAMGGKVGSYVDLVISNLANGTITITAGASVILVGTVGITTLLTATVRFIVTSTTAVRAVIIQSA